MPEKISLKNRRLTTRQVILSFIFIHYPHVLTSVSAVFQIPGLLLNSYHSHRRRAGFSHRHPPGRRLLLLRQRQEEVLAAPACAGQHHPRHHHGGQGASGLQLHHQAHLTPMTFTGAPPLPVQSVVIRLMMEDMTSVECRYLFCPYMDVLKDRCKQDAEMRPLLI